MKIEGRVLVLMTALAGLSLSGCVSSPTYGTDKSAGAQLLDDVSNMASFGQGKKKERIDYKPRPDLVRPAPGDKGYLPAPQQSLASSSDPNWPESPEQRRKRVRDEITAHRDDPNYVSPVLQDAPVADNIRTALPRGNSRREDYASRTPTSDPAKVAALKAARAAEPGFCHDAPLSERAAFGLSPASVHCGCRRAWAGRGAERARAQEGCKRFQGWRDYLPWN